MTRGRNQGARAGTQTKFLAYVMKIKKSCTDWRFENRGKHFLMFTSILEAKTVVVALRVVHK